MFTISEHCSVTIKFKGEDGKNKLNCCIDAIQCSLELIYVHF